MASTSSFSEEDFSCSVCRDIFKEPVVLACSHSFCKACLQEWWTHKGTKECPVCRKINKRKYPPCNLALKNLCEAFTQERHQRPSKHQRTSSGSEDLCSLHTEKHKLFCLQCQQPACVVCRDSKKHTSHSFRPIDEAALDHKEEVQKSLKNLQEKLKVFNEVKTTSDIAAKHIKAQAQNTKAQIMEQFKKLHHFLREEEEARITALREEEQQKSQMMKEKSDALNREISTLSHTIRAIEEDLKAEDISFMQNYKTTVERVQLTPQDPQLVSGAPIDVSKHLGNLTFRVWDKMKDIVSYTPVILDPNTAYQMCVLSDDLTSVTYKLRVFEGQPPYSPERLTGYGFSGCVVGSEGFNSGTHKWDVEVGDGHFWEMGVLSESFQGKGFKDGQRWSIALFDGCLYAKDQVSHQVVSDLSLKQIPQRIRVQLDMNRGKLSFSDPDTNTHLHTFTHTFTDTLFPFIKARPTKTMTILPGKVNVTVE